MPERGVVLKVTALDERIRRKESSLHALELRSCREPDASVPAISSSLRSSLQTGTSEVMRFTETSDSISFLAEIGLVVGAVASVWRSVLGRWFCLY